MLEAAVNTAGEEKLRDRVPATGGKRLGVWRLKFYAPVYTCVVLLLGRMQYTGTLRASTRDTRAKYHRCFDCLVALNVQDQARLPGF